ncbi:LacI family DNA-binding transcriptional regulator [Quadrisphaera sp. DSM 44207]|uniref:LacI family DNA-binding transcriptional regulator n=1 Tax=Quadrisphaera sp. DSM 44207 TaxID=1881057 RepID=UPI000881F5C5|nr:LacI family DNA-binding transcriptional regulator [Quadrisphaera sp. DSM 44207]SDQ64007.1 transcriptional regulator, LacI family [Quadrisphaera sp. DSM 44207]
MPGTTAVPPGPPPRARPTMREVAALAGVSLKTVSRVVNGEEGVSSEMSSAVERAIAQLDYRPNLGASNLRRRGGKTSTIAALLEDLANPFSASVHRAVEDVARSRGTLVFAASVDGQPERERELVRAFTARRVDALVVVPAGQDQSHLYPDVRAGTPVVFVDRPPRGLLADVVLSDNELAAATAVRHLAAAGHRRIGHLGDDRAISTARQRLEGYRRAHLGLGLPVDERLVVQDLRTADQAAAAVARLLSTSAPPTALFTSQNLVTLGAVRALQGLGLQHRVALVGLDDFPGADLLQPRTTVVAQDPAGIGALAAALVFRRLEGEAWTPTTHVVPTRLVPRGSGEIVPAVPGP